MGTVSVKLTAPLRTWFTGVLQRDRPLRHHLLLLVLAALLPALAAGGIGAWEGMQGFRQDYHNRLQQTARALAMAIDAEIAALEVAAVAMATAPTLLTGDLDAFLGRAIPVAQATGTIIFVHGPGPDFPLLRTTAVPSLREHDGLHALPPADSAIRRAAAEGRMIVSDVVISPASGRPTAVLALPAFLDGEIVAVVGVALDLYRLSDLLAGQDMPVGRIAALTDSRRVIAARSQDAANWINHPTPPWWAPVMSGQQKGILVGPAIQGYEIILGFFSLTRAPGWAVAVLEPWNEYLRIWWAPLAWLLLGVSVAAMLAWHLAFALVKGLLRPMRALTSQAHALARGEMAAPRPAPGTVEEFEVLGRALDSAHAVMREALARADAQRAQLQSVLNSMPGAIFVRDSDGRYLMMNERAAELLGRPAQELLGRLPEELLRPEVARSVTADGAIVLAGGPPQSREYTMVDGELAALPAGAEVALEDPKAPLLLAQVARWRTPGKADNQGVVATFHDVTAWRRAQYRLQRAEQEMQSLARRATVGAMASGLAHELSQPLTATLNYLNALQRLLAQPEPQLEAAQDAARRAAALALRAGEIIHRLREFIVHRRLELRPEPVGPLLQDSLRLALSVGDAGDVSVVSDLPAELGEAKLDRVAFQQVMVNLLRNAVEATAGAPERRLGLSARRNPAGELEVRVTDNGPGIDRQVAGRLFEPFASSKPDGMGIGLFISRAITEAHGAQLLLENGEAGATCFLIRLPKT